MDATLLRDAHSPHPTAAPLSEWRRALRDDATRESFWRSLGGPNDVARIEIRADANERARGGDGDYGVIDAAEVENMLHVPPGRNVEICDEARPDAPPLLRVRALPRDGDPRFATIARLRDKLAFLWIARTQLTDPVQRNHPGKYYMHGFCQVIASLAAESSLALTPQPAARTRSPPRAYFRFRSPRSRRAAAHVSLPQSRALLRAAAPGAQLEQREVLDVRPAPLARAHGCSRRVPQGARTENPRDAHPGAT